MWKFETSRDMKNETWAEMNLWKKALWWRTCVFVCVNVFATSNPHGDEFAMIEVFFYFFLFWFRYDVGVWLCLFPSSIHLSLYIYPCLQSPSFTSSPLPPFLFHTQSILLSDRQRLLLILILLSVYTVSSNMVADEISMHYCHPVTDSSTSVCVAMRLLPTVSAVESLMLVDYFIF